eukprot:gene7842-10649_t
MHTIYYLAIIVLSLYCYRKTLRHDFTFDDHLAIVSNGDLSFPIKNTFNNNPYSMSDETHHFLRIKFNKLKSNKAIAILTKKLGIYFQSIEIDSVLRMLSNIWSIFHYLKRNSNYSTSSGSTNGIDKNFVESPIMHKWNAIWRNDIWGKYILEHDSHRSYRPLLIRTFQWLILIDDNKMNPVYFRSINIFIHAIISMLVFKLVYIITRSNRLSLASSLLFASHPIHVEAVTAVVNLSELMSCLFIILAYLTYHWSFHNVGWDNSTRYLQFNFSTIGWIFSLLILSLIWYIMVTISVLYKETGLIVGLIVIGNIVIFMTCDWIKLCFVTDSSDDSNNNSNNHGSKRSIIFSKSSILSFLVWILSSDQNNNSKFDVIQIVSDLLSDPIKAMSGLYLGNSQLIRKAENPFSFLSGKEKILSMMYLHFRYFYQLLYPIEQSPEYSFDCIPKVSDWNDWRNGLSFGLYLAIILVGIIGLYLMVPYKRDVPDKELKDDGVNDNKISNTTSDRKNNETVESSDSLLHALCWLIVPFLPASGVVLKLGTLLAERLLYVPSIGYCMLLSLLLYQTAALLSNCVYYAWRITNPSTVGVIKRRNILEYIIFWACTILIVNFYANRTMAYNEIWKNNETLFTQSLKVCDNSAKMHTQVAKIWVNRGDYKQAIYHINRSKKIDPDFCDVEYQEALVKVAYEQDLSGAIDICLKNLRCLFTSRQSYELLHNIWKMQLEQTNKNNLYQVLIDQGNAAIRAEMHWLGAKKFIEAASQAFESKLYHKSLHFSRKSINVIDYLKNQTNNNNNQSNSSDEIVEAPAQLTCYAFSLSGIIRNFLNMNIKQEKKKGSSSSSEFPLKLTKKIKKELISSKSIFFRAIMPECAYLSDYYDSHGSNDQSQYLVVLHHLSNILSASYNPNNIDSIIENAAFLTIAHFTLREWKKKSQNNHSIKLLKADHKTVAKQRSGNSTNDSLMLNIQTNAGTMWNVIGIQYHGKHNYEIAAKCFKQTLQMFLSPDLGDAFNNIDNNAILSPFVSVLDNEYDYNSKSNSSNNRKHKGKGMSKGKNNKWYKVISSTSAYLTPRFIEQVQLTTIACNALFWYSDAMAGMDGFYENNQAVYSVVLSLRKHASGCIQDNDDNNSNSKTKASSADLLPSLENHLQMIGGYQASDSKNNEKSSASMTPEQSNEL